MENPNSPNNPLFTQGYVPGLPSLPNKKGDTQQTVNSTLSNQDNGKLLETAITAMNQASSAIVQAVSSQSAERQQLAAVQKENMALRMNIERMKKNRTESRFFTETNEGVAISIEIKGEKETAIRIGVIAILSAQGYRICKDGNFKEYIIVTYLDSSRCEHTVSFTEDELTDRKILKYFHGFESECKSKQLANDYLASKVQELKPTLTWTIDEYPGFSSYFDKMNTEKSFFICNTGSYQAELVGLLSQNIISRRLEKYTSDITETTKNICHFLNSEEKSLLFLFQICGILSTPLHETGYHLEQMLLAAVPDYNSMKRAGIYLKLYSKEILSLSLDNNKASLQKLFYSSKDETIVVYDCMNPDNQSRRKEMIPFLLHLDANSKPHNTAVISVSPAVQYIFPKGRKICITLSNEFYSDLLPQEENALCTALNQLTRHFIDWCSERYADLKAGLKERIQGLYEKTSQISFPDMQSRTSWCILTAVYDLLQSSYHFPVSVNHLGNYLYQCMTNGAEKNGTASEMIVNDFISVFNQAVRNHEVYPVSYSKKMNFMPGKNQIIVKENMLALEEGTIVQTILPHMASTDSILHILQSLKEDNLLYTSSKGEKESLRYKLTVYNNNQSSRHSFIAIEKDGILDNDISIMLNSLDISEWFMPKLPEIPFIPVITDHNGFIAGQEFRKNQEDNLHFFTTGIPGSGKTHHLTERMCSFQKAGIHTIILDTSDSFTKERIIHNLSIGGDDSVLQQVTDYVEKNITFHEIQNQGIPVEPFQLSYSGDKDEIENILYAIIMSHFGSTGKVQKVIVSEIISELAESGDFSAKNIYRKIMDSSYLDDAETLKAQLISCLSCFENHTCIDRNWNTLIAESKNIIVISMNSSSKSGGYALIDILMMSLFYHQRFHPSQHTGIFIDEIHNQNLTPQGAITQILREGRKFRISLNYATQFSSKKNDDRTAVIQLAGLSAFFQPDDTSLLSVSKSLGISQRELLCMNTGEGYIKGSVYNSHKNCIENKILHGCTYRNFVPFQSK